MLILNLYFIFFLLIAICSILVSNPVLAVLCLILVFVLGSAFIVVLGLDYLGVLLLLVYVGAISVLFLFVVMMLNVRQTELNQSLIKFWWLGVLVSFFFFFELMLCAAFVWDSNDIIPFFSYISSTSDLTGSNWVSIVNESTNIEMLGEFLFLYNWDFLIIAILLLFVAVLGPVYLSGLNTFFVVKENGWTQISRAKVEQLKYKRLFFI